MGTQQTIEVCILGMDCTECTRHVQRAIAALPGVEAVEVLLSAEKAVVSIDPAQVQLPAIHCAIENAGYRVTAPTVHSPAAHPSQGEQLDASRYVRRVATLLTLVVGAVLFIVVIGEWLGLFAALTGRIPAWLGLLFVAAGGWPIFVNVVRAAARRQVTAHTLMTLGVVAALAVGEWMTAAVVVFLMRIGNYTEQFTAESARRAVKDLAQLAPRTARIEHDGVETEVPVASVAAGDIVVVRPGEMIPVDGEVLSGHATVDQATITGESLPVDIGPNDRVFAATIARLGTLRIRTTRVGNETTFGRVVKLVEEAEARRGDVQRFADRFSGYYLPVVAGIALLTLLLRRDPLATAAVLVVACSCSIALATPIAMLASIGAAARRGLLIRGGKYIETLARADVLLIDKTGTLTTGAPQITDVLPLNGHSEQEVLALAAAVERYSEHPLAVAVSRAAAAQQIAPVAVQEFTSVPGRGACAMISGVHVQVGNRRFMGDDVPLPDATALTNQGKSLLFVSCDGEPVGLLAAADTPRTEAYEALAAVRRLGIDHIELLTGDHEGAAAMLADQLGIAYRANLLPEDKIAIVQAYQAQGRTVIMVGDGVNDAPALSQADVGIAMAHAGADIAVEAAHIALLREDWSLIPELLQIARRTMGVVKLNLGFTAVYNLVGLTLAAFGFLPPILAAAAQSLPDLGILTNSARLLRVRPQILK